MGTKDMMGNAAPITMALVTTGGFFGFIYLLFTSPEIPKENAAQLNILLGGIGVVWAKAIGFFYDSSASSKAKDEVIGAIAKAVPTGTGNGTVIPEAVKDMTVTAEDVTINKKDETV